MRTRIRQLSNGKYVAEVWSLFYWWRGIDALFPRFAWPKGDTYYPSCWCDTRDDAMEAIKKYKAVHGK